MTKALLLPLIFCCFAIAGHAQSLLFGEDTILLHSCEARPDLTGLTQMYNTTDTFVYVKWHIEQFSLPHNGVYALIIAGYQYVPFEDGHQFIFTYDSSEVIFYMWNDTLLPGDTSLMQIRIWDDMDSVNSTTLLTAIQVCPLSTAVRPDLPQIDCKVFPNPAADLVYVQFSHDQPNHVRLLNALGEIIQEKYTDERLVSLDTSMLPPGIYMLTALQDGQPVGCNVISIQR